MKLPCCCWLLVGESELSRVNDTAQEGVVRFIFKKHWVIVEGGLKEWCNMLLMCVGGVEHGEAVVDVAAGEESGWKLLWKLVDP